MFTSRFTYRDTAEVPAFSGTRVMMLPVVIGEVDSVPDMVGHYRPLLGRLFDMAGHRGKVGYLTVDEKHLEPGAAHRRRGLHVDGVYHGRVGAWGSGGSWGSAGNGMLTVSSHRACRAWNQEFDGAPGSEGECEHLRSECRADGERAFGAGEVYWLDGLCVHESMPVEHAVDRQFVRLSLPSNGPWFEGYTANPLGVAPTGEILPPREFMSA